MRSVHSVAGYVIPKRSAFRILHDKKPIIESYSFKPVPGATNGRNQTGSTVTNHSKRRQPVLSTSDTLSYVMVGHLVTEQGDPASSSLDDKHHRVLTNLLLGKNLTQCCLLYTSDAADE